MAMSFRLGNPLTQALEQLLEDPFGQREAWRRGGMTGRAVQPMPLDVYATADQVVVLAAVPGLRPDHLEITVHQNTVTISGAVPDVTQAEEAKQATWYVHELWSGQYQRSLTLPFELDAERAEASVADGIARIVLPKAERAKPRKLAIQGGDQATPVAATTPDEPSDAAATEG
jgi:HSP20 family protein